MNKYDYLQLLVLFITPVAPALAYGWGIYNNALSMGMVWWLAIPGGIAAAIALEGAGIYAGHVFLEAWRQGQKLQTLLGIGALIIYVAIGMYELQGTPLMSLFLIAGMVYVVVGSREALQKGEKEISTQAEHEAINERKAQDQEHELKMERIAASKEVKIARINADTIGKLPKVTEDLPKVTESVPKITRWSHLNTAQKRKVAYMTTKEVAQAFNVSERTALNWRRNGKALVKKSNGQPITAKGV